MVDLEISTGGAALRDPDGADWVAGVEKEFCWVGRAGARSCLGAEDYRLRVPRADGRTGLLHVVRSGSSSTNNIDSLECMDLYASNTRPVAQRSASTEEA